MTEPEVKTAPEASVRLGVSVPTIRRWADDGQLEPFRRDPLLFTAESVERRAAEMITELRAQLAHLTGVTV